MKQVSHLGGDIRGNFRKVDYGNKEYKTFIVALALIDQEVARLISRLSEYWPSMATPYQDTETALVKQGDIMEVLFAAVRGDTNIFGESYRQPGDGPHIRSLNVIFCQACQGIQFFNGKFDTGYLKYRKDRIPLFKERWDFVEAWTVYYTHLTLPTTPYV